MFKNETLNPAAQCANKTNQQVNAHLRTIIYPVERVYYMFGGFPSRVSDDEFVAVLLTSVLLGWYFLDKTF